MSFRIAGLLIFLGLASSAFAQDATKAEFSGGLSYMHSNAADGMCGCFSLVGGDTSFVVNANQRLSAVADFGYQHSANINSTGYDLGLVTYMAGPRVSFRGQKLTVFGQALMGRANATSTSVFNNGSGLAGSTGAGVDLRLTQRFSWRILEADYVLTRIPNGENNIQNNMRFSMGVVFRLGWLPPQGPHRPYDRPY
jgi:peptidoglycan-associated lipoprotein